MRSFLNVQGVVSVFGQPVSPGAHVVFRSEAVIKQLGKSQ